MFPRAAPVILFALLAVIAALLLVTQRHAGSGKQMRIAADIQVFARQLKLYQTVNGSFPSTQQGLQSLVEEPTESPRPKHWRQLLGYVPKDPWNSEYVYRCPGTTRPNGYDLFSPGPDRKPYTADDDWGE